MSEDIIDFDMTAILGALEGLRGSAPKDLEESDQGDLAWGEIPGEAILVCHDVIQEMMDNKSEDKVPDCLLEAVHIISETSSEIDVNFYDIRLFAWYSLHPFPPYLVVIQPPR